MTDNLSEKFFEVLNLYDGSVQDRQKKYLVSTFAYDPSLSVYDMEYQKLRELGYTGTLQDMWSAYIISLGGSGLEAKARLLSSTFYGAINPYIVNNLIPEFVADFSGAYSVDGEEFYYTDGATTFSSAITHAATSNATMTGLRKWSLHNLLEYSEDFTNAAWSNRNISLSDNGDGSFNVTATANYGDIRQIVTFSDPATVAVYVKRVSGSGNVNLYTPSATTNETIGLTDEWQLFTLSNTPSGNAYLRVELAVSGDVIAVKYPHLYRSDRGGMVLAADGSTYLATTGTAVEPVRVDAEGGVGEICWRPHNLLPNSGDLTAGTWTQFNGASAAGSDDFFDFTENTDNDLHVTFDQVSLTEGATYTLKAIVKPGLRTSCSLRLDNGTATQRSIFNLSTAAVATEAAGHDNATITDRGDGSYLLSVDCTITGGTTPIIGVEGAIGTSTTYAGDDSAVAFSQKEIHLYRSDLGGMVSNPDTGDSYVPTTSAAVYLPRTGHHIYKPEEGAIVGAELGNPDNLDKRDGTDGTLTRSGGVINFDNADAGLSTAISEELTVEVGKVYRLSASVRLVSGSPVGLQFRSNDGGGGSGLAVGDTVSSATFETVSVTWVADRTTVYPSVLAPTGSEFEVDASSYTIREVNPWVNEGLLLESEARTNHIRNSVASGAVVGSPGTRPTYWAYFGGTATTEIAGTGTEAGATYVDIRVLGSPSSAAILNFEDSTHITASPTENWSLSFNARIVAGSTTNVAELRPSINWRDAGGFLSRITGDDFKDEASAGLRTISGEAPTGTTAVLPQIFINASGAVDFTLRIYSPQMEPGSTPSSYIPTNGSTADRAAETLTIPAANLPWPTPNVIGDELVTNGTFDTDSDWTLESNWEITGGKLISSGGLNSSYVSTPASFIAGNSYQVTLTVTRTQSQDLKIWLGDDVFYSFDELASNEKITIVLTASVNSSEFQLETNAAGGWEVDNISVREIDPLAVSIQMEGTMTYAQTQLIDEVDFIRWQDDVNNRIPIVIDTRSPITGTVRFAQVASGVADIVTSGASDYSPGVNVPFNIASRHGSTFINGAVDGTALTADTTPVALPDLSATDLEIGETFMGTIKRVRIWDADIGDTGIAEASS